MKSNEEMIKNVFRRINEYNSKKIAKRIINTGIFFTILISVIGVIVCNSTFFKNISEQNDIIGGQITHEENTSEQVLIVNGVTYKLVLNPTEKYTKKNQIDVSIDFNIRNYDLISGNEKIFTVFENDYTLLLETSNGEVMVLCEE